MRRLRMVQMIQRIAQHAAAIAGAVFMTASMMGCAWADRRVALVIGNSAYQAVAKLPNPSRDAAAVAKMFKDAGFDSVETESNAGNLELKRAFRRFEATADQADVAVIYYAGHGLEINNTNYLIPVDAKLASDRDADDEAIPLERLVSSADGAKKLRVIILDACRNNPFAVSMRRERKVANRAVVSGLGKVEPTATDTLIAYAAKAGSTADDGDGDHSPFTTSLLKNMTIPGLDIRLAFGRVRDEVLKITGNKQEPFVYGSLGGGNVSLVPALPVPQATPLNDIKGDYDLVAQINSRRAWEVFLSNYKTGFYSDLARLQLAKFVDEPATPKPPGGNITAPAVPPATITPGREQAAKEVLDWDKIKSSSDQDALQDFIRRYPNSPLALAAQQRLDLVREAAREREERNRADRDAAAKAQEEARLAAEKRKAEALAAKRRDDDERRARLAESERQAKLAEAERRATEARLKAEAAEKSRADSEAAALRAESERQTRMAEIERRRIEAAAALEAACKQQQTALDGLVAKGSDGSGVDDLRTFAKTVTCDRVRSQTIATLDGFNKDAAKRLAVLPNSPELIRAAQTQLARIGCAPGRIDGTLNTTTKSALDRFFKAKDKPIEPVSITGDFVSELSKQADRVCVLECKAGESLKGSSCVPDKASAPVASRRPKDDDDDEPVRRKPAKQADRERARPSPAASRVQAERPRPAAVAARVQALRPGGGSSPMIGVGF